MDELKSIAESLTELDIEALRGTLGAWDSETRDRLRSLDLASGVGAAFHITALGKRVAECAVSGRNVPEGHSK